MNYLDEQLLHIRRNVKPLPEDWSLIVGADTGTYMSAAFYAISPGDDPQPLCLGEFPNYRYVSHEIELLGLSTPEWARRVYAAFRYLQPRKEKCIAWCDTNTQFRAELAHYGISLRGNTRGLELRVEIGREYLQSKMPNGADRELFAPWIEILLYEIEHAKWPDGTTVAGKFVRIKEHDHTLDCREHALSRRPRSKLLLQKKRQTFIERFMSEHGYRKQRLRDPHLGLL